MSALFSNQSDQCFRLMGVQLVRDEDPPCLRISDDSGVDMFGKVLFGAGFPDCGGEHFAGVDLKAGNQGLRAVTDVFEFAPFRLSRFHGMRWMEPLQRLDTGHFVSADHMDSLFMSSRCEGIGVAYSGDLLIESLRIIIFGIQPIARLMRFKVCIFLKSALQSGAICWLRYRVWWPHQPIPLLSSG